MSRQSFRGSTHSKNNPGREGGQALHGKIEVFEHSFSQLTYTNINVFMNTWKNVDLTLKKKSIKGFYEQKAAHTLRIAPSEPDSRQSSMRGAHQYRRRKARRLLLRSVRAECRQRRHRTNLSIRSLYIDQHHSARLWSQVVG